MDRKRFLRTGLLGTAAAAFGLKHAAAKAPAAAKASTYDRLKDQVGFNHLPNAEAVQGNAVYHPADSRGGADHGWLKTRHSFSFAQWYNPDRMAFGVLRVLNDDVVAPGRGFPTHPHDNMEIVSIPLSGDLEHQDSMGNVAVIRQGDVQVMSAGTGIRHSEYNRNKDREVRFLQIWMFPRQRQVEPRYDQVRFAGGENGPSSAGNSTTVDRPKGLKQILSPNPDDAGVWVHQDAWFDLGQLPAGERFEHRLRKTGNGIYAFLINGQVQVNGQLMQGRDGYGVWDADRVAIEVSQDAQLLLMEVPMRI